MDNLLKTISFTSKEIRRVRFDYHSLQKFKNHLRPTVFLGLGGGGCKAVGAVKSLFDSTFGGKDEPGASRIPDILKFLGFDSDTEKPDNLVIDQEWFHMRSEGLDGGVWESLRQQPQNREWVSQTLSAQDLGAGCKGFRGLGRFLFQQNLGGFLERVEKAYGAATGAKVEGAIRPPVFYLFTTLAGGTGSGCLLDACFALRANFPGAEIRAFLALPEGFGDSPMLIRRAKVGVYAALKEFDHFMSAERLKSWIDEKNGGKAEFTFPNGRSGRFTKPANLAFLFSPITAAERNTLRDPALVSFFMARCAFALTAWPSDDGREGSAGMTFESHLSNFDTELMEGSFGANCCYLVPGFGGVHTPVEETGDLLALESAQRVLEWLKHGNGNPEHAEEAAHFLADTGFTAENLVEVSKELLNSDGALVKESSEQCLQDLLAVFKSGKRYDPTHNTVLYRSFNVMLESRFKEEVLERILDYAPDEEARRESQMHGKAGTVDPRMFSLRDTMGRFCESFEKTINQMMVDPKYRRVGVEDFLGDTLLLLKRMQVLVGAPVDGASRTLREMLDGHWRKGCKFRDLLDDVCTKGGLFDFDSLQVGELSGDYTAHFIAGWAAVEQWIKNAAVLYLVKSAVRYVERRRTEIEEVFGNFDAAAARIDEKINDLVRDLKLQADGMGDDLETLNSTSLFDLRWRDRFVRRNKLANTEEVVRRARDAAGGMLSQKPASAKGGQFEIKVGGECYSVEKRTANSGAADWNPLGVTASFRDPKQNPNQQPLDLFISQDLANAMMRVIDPNLQPLSQWEGGVGLRTAFEYASDQGLASPDTLVSILQSLLWQCQPQANISMMSSRLDRQTSNLIFFAGPETISTDLLRGHVQAKFINRALTFESHRMALSSCSYPISLAGMPRVASVFKQTYDAYFDELKANEVALEEERRKLHCYPRSWEWRDPWEVDEPADPAHDSVGKAILISWAMEDSDLLPESARDLLNKAIESMHSASPAPRTKGLGAFIIAGNEVWIAPFCSPDLAKNTLGDIAAPVRLGLTLSESMSAIVKGEHSESRDHLDRWIRWFESNKTSLFSEEVLKALRSKLVERSKERMAAAQDADRAKWKIVVRHANSPFICGS